jgi:hypothetical protein
MVIKKYFIDKRNLSKTVAILTFAGFIITSFYLNNNTNSIESKKILFDDNIDSLPQILTKNHADLINNKLRLEAELDFSKHQLPNILKDWESYSVKLKNKIKKNTKIVISHNLPLNTEETSTIYLNGFSIKKISFQTRPGIYVTANLYMPDRDYADDPALHFLKQFLLNH